MVYLITSLLIFDIPLLCQYFNLKSSVISCLSSGDIYLSLGISLLFSFITVSKLFCCEFCKTFMILLAILFPIKSPVASAVFLMNFFEEFLSASVADCLAWSISF